MYSDATIRRKSDRLLEIDADLIHRKLNQEPFAIDHNLAGHPLFGLPRLIELARRMRAEDVEYNAGNLSVQMDPELTPRNGLPIEETIRRIETCSSWMVLKWVERDPEYRDLMDACLEEVRSFSDKVVPGMRGKEAFIFISSPGAVTPFHFDPEYNFLLQVRGTKAIHVFPQSLVTPREIEDRFATAHRNLAFQEHYQSSAATFHLQPGVGVHVPIAAPHWVKVGPDVSISFSITFRTPDSDRVAALHRMNGYLRRFGLTPSPVGISAPRDHVKFYAFQWAKRVSRGLNGLGVRSIRG